MDKTIKTAVSIDYKSLEGNFGNSGARPNVKFDDFDIKQGNTLENPQHIK